MKLPTLPALTAIQWALTALAVVVVLVAGWWLVTAPGREAQRAAEARAAGIQSAANAASASDAAKTTDAAHNQAAANEQQSRETADVIRHTPGADQPLDPRLNDAARRRLCLHPAYARSEQCLQFTRGADSSH